MLKIKIKYNYQLDIQLDEMLTELPYYFNNVELTGYEYCGGFYLFIHYSFEDLIININVNQVYEYLTIEVYNTENVELPYNTVISIIQQVEELLRKYLKDYLAIEKNINKIFN